MMIAVWMVLIGIVLFFLIASKLLFARALFRTKVLQWARHQRTQVKPEALWVWRIAMLLTIVISIGEYRKLGNPIVSSEYGMLTWLGLVAIALGLWTWMAAMDARRQYFWYFQVLAPKEDLPAFSTDGVYSMVRNPRELGLLLVMAGLALAFSLLFTLVFVVLFLFATVFRANSRDRILLEKHGKAYIDYMRTSKKLIPYVY